MKVVLITDLKNDFDKELAAAFAHADFKVFAISSVQIEGVIPLPLEMKEAAAALKKESGHIDIYIDVSDERSPSDDFTVRGDLNDKVMRELYDANVTRPMALLETFLPLLESGEGKRLCFLTSAQASINETRGIDGYGYKMAKAALHNFLQITRNVLAPKGFTIRAFDPSRNEVPPEAAAQAALNYFVRRRGVERGDERRDDEGNLVFRDAYGRHHPW
jgi:NAD(P)-dependent dehydrogenase (short-subunit alcohol dehydrogenase family)